MFAHVTPLRVHNNYFSTVRIVNKSHEETKTNNRLIRTRIIFALDKDHPCVSWCSRICLKNVTVVPFISINCASARMKKTSLANELWPPVCVTFITRPNARLVLLSGFEARPDHDQRKCKDQTPDPNRAPSRQHVATIWGKTPLRGTLAPNTLLATQLVLSNCYFGCMADWFHRFWQLIESRRALSRQWWSAVHLCGGTEGRRKSLMGPLGGRHNAQTALARGVPAVTAAFTPHSSFQRKSEATHVVHLGYWVDTGMARAPVSHGHEERSASCRLFICHPHSARAAARRRWPELPKG